MSFFYFFLRGSPESRSRPHSKDLRLYIDRQCSPKAELEGQPFLKRGNTLYDAVSFESRKSNGAALLKGNVREVLGDLSHLVCEVSRDDSSTRR